MLSPTAWLLTWDSAGGRSQSARAAGGGRTQRIRSSVATSIASTTPLQGPRRGSGGSCTGRMVSARALSWYRIGSDRGDARALPGARCNGSTVSAPGSGATSAVRGPRPRARLQVSQPNDQKMAIGLTGEPVPLESTKGAMTQKNSQRPSDKQTSLTASRPQLSTSHSPIAHIPTAWIGIPSS